MIDPGNVPFVDVSFAKFEIDDVGVEGDENDGDDEGDGQDEDEDGVEEEEVGLAALKLPYPVPYDVVVPKHVEVPFPVSTMVCQTRQ